MAEETSDLSVSLPKSPASEEHLLSSEEGDSEPEEISSSPSSERSTTPVPEGQFEVEKIINFVKDSKSGPLYLVKWKNWDEESNTWEPLQNLLQCEFALTDFFLRRRAEIASIEAQVEYTETSDGKRRRRGPPKLHLPPDPRPVSIVALEYYESTSPPTEEEVKECEISWLSQRAKERAAKANNKKKAVQPSTFVWPLNKITKVLQDAINGKLGAAETVNLRTQLMYYEFERRQIHSANCLKNWEKHINGISAGNPIIKVENEVDLEGPPTNFTYINDYVPGPGITIPDDPPLGCSCVGSCYDNRKNCCSAEGFDFAYTPYKKLKVPVGTPIYECNKKCGCGPECANRVVQNGNGDLRLVVFRTPTGMGWGVKTMKNIKRGSFVSLYVGEIIRTEEAERRGREYDADGCTYLFDLDFNEGETCPFTVDAAKYGNIAHFINHSCDPNLAVFSVWVNCLDPNLPKLALFAIKDIGYGEELFFDYKNDLNKDGTEKSTLATVLSALPSEPTTPTKRLLNSPTEPLSPAKRLLSSPTEPEKERKPCLCGTVKCRKFLF